MKIVFFNRPTNKKFDYKPLYYNKAKDKREQRARELGLDVNKKEHKSFFKGELQREWRSNQTPKEQSKKVRSILYLVLLLIAIYYIFFTDIVQNMVSSFISH